MIRLITLDFVLRVAGAGVMGISLIVNVPGMDLDDMAADMPGFGIPGNVIADFELHGHVTKTTRKDANGLAGELVPDP